MPAQLINQKIRKAEFVKVTVKNTQKFKYKLIFGIVKWFKDKLHILKPHFIKRYQALLLASGKVDWQKVKFAAGVYLCESFVEGLLANFTTHFLFGVRFSLFSVFAHGFAIKQFLSIYWRLKKDGPPTTILKN